MAKIVHMLFNKSLKELTKEERRQYNNFLNRRSYKKNRKRERKVRTDTLVYEMFGKSKKDLTKEERSQYLKATQFRALKKEMEEIRYND